MRAFITIVALAVTLIDTSLRAADRAAELEKEFKELKRSDAAADAPFIQDPVIRREEASPEIEARLANARARTAESQKIRTQAEADLLEAARQRENADAAVRTATRSLSMAENWLEELHQLTETFPYHERTSAFAKANAAIETAQDVVRDALTDQKNHGAAFESASKTAEGARARTIQDEAREAKLLEKRRQWIAAHAPREQLGLSVQQRTILVRFTDTASVAQIKEVLKKHNLEVRGGIAEIALFVTVVRPDTPPEDEPKLLRDTIEALRGEEGVVVSAFPNVAIGPSVITRESSLPDWNWFQQDNPGTAAARLTRLPAAWNFRRAISRRGSENIKIAVLDTGFSRHDDLDFSPARVCMAAPHFHGNHVIGIIGARFDNGIGIDGGSPFGRLITCTARPVSDESPGDESVIDDPSIEEEDVGDLAQLDFDCEELPPDPDPIPPPALEALSQRRTAFYQTLWSFRQLARVVRPRVINVSLGYKWVELFAGRGVPSEQPEIQKIVDDQGSTTRALLARYPNVLVVSAAGNDCGSRPCCTDPAKWTSPFNWAALSETRDPLPRSNNVLVVESTDRQGRQSHFTNRDGTIAAPGEDILSTVEDNAFFKHSGTSMAAPAVTAVVALMLAYNPRLTIDEIRDILDVERQNPPARIDAFEALIRSRPQSFHDLADLNDDGRVDMRDFKKLRKQLEAVEAMKINEDLNGDRLADANDLRYPRADLNGDFELSATEKALVPGVGEVTDLEVMMHAWQDRRVPKDDLPKLLAKRATAPTSIAQH